LSDASTYDRKGLAKRKDETADAYDGDVGRQERDGGEKVQEGRVCSETLYRNHQSPRSDMRVCLFSENRKDDARCILHPSRDSGDLRHTRKRGSVSRMWDGALQDGHKGTHPF